MDLPYFWYSPRVLAELDKYPRQSRAAAREHWFHLYRPSPGDVVVDVGAGVGWDTLEFSHAVGPSGRVIAIEAHPTTFNRLQRMCELNGLDNVECWHFAAFDRKGSVSIQDGSNDLANRVCTSGGGVLDVEARTLDDVLCDVLKIETIALLKMNIEGAEVAALAGSERTLSRTQVAAIAAHTFRADQGEHECFDTRDAVFKTLQENGFDISTRDHDSRPWVRDHIHGSRHSRSCGDTSKRAGSALNLALQAKSTGRQQHRARG